MQHQRLIRPYVAATLLLVLLFNIAGAQTGSFKATFSPQNGGKPIILQFSQPLLKFDNSHGYWLINPHTGDRHLQFKPDAGYGDRTADVAFITFNEKTNDFDFYEGGGNDSNELMIQNKTVLISAPRYDLHADSNKPLHIHINSFTAAEISFSISGVATSTMIQDNGTSPVSGTIEGSGHFYREPKYIQSDILPGCDCDPAIYATVYDEEDNVRTTSGCENALQNKVFDAVQKAMAPLFTNIAYKGKGAMQAGNIDISMMPGHINIKVPVKDRAWCSSDYRHNWLTGIGAHKIIFQNDDGYGLRFIRMPGNDQMNGGHIDQRRLGILMDSLTKLAAAKKISSEQYKKALSDFANQSNTGMADFKQLEVENNLYLQVFINPAIGENTLLKITDKNKTRIEHTVKGAAYEVFCPEMKSSDGSWIGNRQAICFGKFMPPQMGKSGGGFDAEIMKPLYPSNSNKLTVYNIIIKMEGGKDLMDKAIANIDFASLIELISKQQ
jgi:hypothetical protein